MHLNKTNNFQELCNRLFHVLYVLGFGFILINVYISWGSKIPAVTIVAVLMVLIILGFYYFIVKVGLNVVKYSKWIVAFAMLLLTIVQLYVSVKLSVKPSWDFGFVYDEAVSIVQTGNYTVQNLPYFLRYPNNWFYLIMLTGLFSFLQMFGITNFLMGGLCFNILMINTTILLTYVICCKIWDKKIAIFLLILSLFFAPYYTYIPIFYTDTFPMPFMMAMIYLFLFAIKTETKKQYLYLAVIGVLCFIGYSLKATVMIMLFAMIIFAFLKQGWRYMIKFTLVVMACFVLVNTGYQKVINHASFIDTTDLDKHNFPYTHWIMMGLENPGGYNAEDDYFTRSFPSKEAKAEANIAEIKNRLTDYGIFGFLDHLKIKSTETWNDGTYFSTSLLNRKPIEKNYMHSFILKSGRYYGLYFSYVNGYQLVLLIFMFLSGVYGFLNPKVNLMSLLRLAVFGLMLFLLIWESKSKYLLNFTPLFFLIAMDGFLMIKTRISNHYIRDRK